MRSGGPAMWSSRCARNGATQHGMQRSRGQGFRPDLETSIDAHASRTQNQYEHMPIRQRRVRQSTSLGQPCMKGSCVNVSFSRHPLQRVPWHRSSAAPRCLDTTPAPRDRAAMHAGVKGREPQQGYCCAQPGPHPLRQDVCTPQ